MKILSTVMAVVAMSLLAQAQTSNVVYSPNVVGFVKLTVPGTNTISMVAVPFEASNSRGYYTLDEVLGTNFTAHSTDGVDCDEVWMWNSAANRFEQAFLNDGEWYEPTIDWKWCYTGGDGHPLPCAGTNLFNITPTSGFFINNQHGDRTVFISGMVPTNSVTTVDLTGLQLTAYPYPVAQSLATMLGTNDGARADSRQSPVSDEIWIYNATTHNYDQYFLNDGEWGDPTIDWKWCSSGADGTPVAATNTMQPGMSFFYNAKGAGFDWNVVRPYPLN